MAPTEITARLDTVEELLETPSRRALGFSDAAFSLIDQVSFSLSHFGLTILLARWLAPVAFGAFSFGFSTLLLVAALYNAVATEPLLMFGASRFRSGFRSYLGVVMRAHCAFSVAIGAIAVLSGCVARIMGSPEAAQALFGVAIATPLVLLSWLLRPACYVLRRTSWAGLSGVIYFVVLIGSLATLHEVVGLTTFTAFLAMALASASACICLVIFLRPTLRKAPADFTESVKQAHLGFGGLNLVAASFTWLSGQILIFLIPFFMGFSSVAMIAAALNFYRPLQLIMRSATGLILPVSAELASSREGLKTLATRSRRFVLGSGLGVLAYSLLLTACAGPLFAHVYGAKYESHPTAMFLLGLAYTGSILVQADALVLKAIGKMRAVVMIWLFPALVTAVLSVPALLTRNVTVVLGVYAASYLTAAVIARFKTSALLREFARDGTRKPSLSLLHRNPPIGNEAPGPKLGGANPQTYAGSPLVLRGHATDEAHRRGPQEVDLPASADGSEGRAFRVSILLALGRELDREGVQFCLVHGLDRLGESSGDFDLIAEPAGLHRFERALRNTPRIRLIQLLQHEATCYFFVAASHDDRTFVQFDVATDYRRDGRVYFSAAELLRGRQRLKHLWVPGYEAEFSYLIVKKISKLDFPRYQRLRLEYLAGKLPDKAEQICRRLLGSRRGAALFSAMRNGDWAPVEGQMPGFKRALRWNALRHDPLNALRYWIPELRRKWKRWKHPSGLFVALLGPDGAGKSTVGHQATTILTGGSAMSGGFRRADRFHLRPRTLSSAAESGVPVLDPHGVAPRSYFASIGKLGFYVLDYCFGYLTRLRPKLVRSSLLLADRYYDDLLIDRRRYRYGGPTRLLAWCRRLVPDSDVLIVLDAAESQLLERKQEISGPELSRQRRAYRALVGDRPNAFLIDGSRSKEMVARDLGAACLDFMGDRCESRRAHRSAENWDEDLRWLSSALLDPARARFVAGGAESQDSSRNASLTFLKLTPGLGRGYLIPAGQGAVRGLDLYNAQRMKARFARATLSAAARSGLASRLLPSVSLQVFADADGDLEELSVFEHLKALFRNEGLGFAVSLGTPGPHRKPVIQVIGHDGEAAGYFKIGTAASTNRLVQNEIDMLRLVRELQLRSCSVPTVLSFGAWRGRPCCVQSAPEGRLENAPSALTDRYCDIVTELSTMQRTIRPWSSSGFWREVVSSIPGVRNRYYRHLLEEGASAVERRLRSVELPFHFCHGDFAPWNAKQSRNGLYVFDWECADPQGPPGWDLFHFLTETGLLLQRATPRQLLDDILSGPASDRLRKYLQLISIREEWLAPLYLAYLVCRLSLYARVDEGYFRKRQQLAALTAMTIGGLS